LLSPMFKLNADLPHIWRNALVRSIKISKKTNFYLKYYFTTIRIQCS
jgi:hypothetical protein